MRKYVPCPVAVKSLRPLILVSVQHSPLAPGNAVFRGVRGENVHPFPLRLSHFSLWHMARSLKSKIKSRKTISDELSRCRRTIGHLVGTRLTQLHATADRRGAMRCPYMSLGNPIHP